MWYYGIITQRKIYLGILTQFAPVLKFEKVQNRFAPVLKFEKVLGKVTELPEQVFNELSSDQQYLHSMSIAVQNGIIHELITLSYPGNYHHARWLTLANRILRLYVCTQTPQKI